MAEQIEEHVILAYALGELDGEELQQVEDAVAADEKLQQLVDEYREVGIGLVDALKSEPMPAMTSEQHKAIDAEAARIAERRPTRSPWTFAALVAAASLVFLAVAIPVICSYFLRQRNSHRMASGITRKPEETKSKTTPDKDHKVHVRVIVAKPEGRPFAITSTKTFASDDILAGLELTASGPKGDRVDPPIGDPIPRKADRGLNEPGDVGTRRLPSVTYVIGLPQIVARTPIADLGALIRSTGRAPKANEVGLAELINCFEYSHPFTGSVGGMESYVEEGACPWDPSKRLVMIALRGDGEADIGAELQLASNVVASYRLLGVDHKPLDENTEHAGDGPLKGTLTMLCEVTMSSPLPAGKVLGVLSLNTGESVATIPIAATGRGIGEASRTFRLAVSMGAYGMLVQQPALRGRLTFDDVSKLYEKACDPKQADQVAMQMLMIQTAKLTRVTAKQ